MEGHIEAPRDDPRKVWDHSLQGALGAVLLFSAFMVVLGSPAAAFFDWMIFGRDESPVVGDEARAYVSFVYGVLGAVMIGWMVALVPIVQGPLRRRQRWAWRSVAASFTAWFVVDSTLSVLSGFGENALLNVVFFAAFAIPLANMRAELEQA